MITESGGLQHWWHQRLTAVALIPLSLWMGFSLASVPNANYAEISAWVGSPLNALLLIAFLVSAFYHSILGIQAVIEDYVQTEDIRAQGLVVTKVVFILLGVVSVLSILKVVMIG